MHRRKKAEYEEKEKQEIARAAREAALERARGIEEMKTQLHEAEEAEAANIEQSAHIALSLTYLSACCPFDLPPFCDCVGVYPLLLPSLSP